MELENLGFADLISLKNEFREAIVRFEDEFSFIEIDLIKLNSAYYGDAITINDSAKPNKGYKYSNETQKEIILIPHLYEAIHGKNTFYYFITSLENYVNNIDRYYFTLTIFENKIQSIFDVKKAAFIDQKRENKLALFVYEQTNIRVKELTGKNYSDLTKKEKTATIDLLCSEFKVSRSTIKNNLNYIPSSKTKHRPKKRS